MFDGGATVSSAAWFDLRWQSPLPSFAGTDCNVSVGAAADVPGVVCCSLSLDEPFCGGGSLRLDVLPCSGGTADPARRPTSMQQIVQLFAVDVPAVPSGSSL
jgi:hypothetical protein